MTVLVAIVVYAIALLLVLILAAGVRRGDERHARSLRHMRNPTRERADTPRPEHYASPWSKAPKEPERTAVDTRGRRAVKT